MKYELWGNEDGYSFLPEDHSQKELITEDEVLIWTAEAETWQEACFKRNEYLGWNPYRPMCPHCKSDITYGEECCEDCKER